MALQSIRTLEKIDYVRKEFSELNSKFNEAWKKTLVDLQERFDFYFGDKGKITEIIEQHFGENGRIVRDIFDPDKEGTPLYNLRHELSRKFDQLNVDITSKIAAREAEEGLVQKTPLKGLKFQDWCWEVLSSLAKQQVDESVDKVTDRPGLGTSKEGDFVLSLGEGKGRIVFEVKDVHSMRLAQIRDTLDKAMKNREATYGVFVAKNLEALDKSVGWFNEYYERYLICAVSSNDSDVLREEILHIAYKWAKARIQIQALSKMKLLPMDLKKKVDTIHEKLARFNTVIAKCDTIGKAAREIEKICKEMEEQIENELRGIDIYLSRAS